MKTLRTKQINVAVCWSYLKSVPPKEYDSMADIEKSVVIVSKLAEVIPEFVEHRKAGEDFNKQVIKNEIQDEAVCKQNFLSKLFGVKGKKVVKTAGQKIDEWHREYEKKTEQIGEFVGSQIVEVNFDDAEFNTFFQFCNNRKWGAKMWFSEVPRYIEFLQDLNKTNQQPKSK